MPKKPDKCCLARACGGAKGKDGDAEKGYYDSSSDSALFSDSDDDVETQRLKNERKKKLAAPKEDRCCTDVQCCVMLVIYTALLGYLFVMCSNFSGLFEPRDSKGHKCA